MGKQWKQWQTFFAWAPNQCRWWLQSWNEKTLAPWKKSYDQTRQHFKKHRHYLTDKSLSSQSYGFSISHYGCESWTIKKGEGQRIDAIELWCWRRLLRVPWTARRSNQSILKKSTLNIHWKDWSWSSSTWATWYKEPIHWKKPCCWERLKAKGEGCGRG